MRFVILEHDHPERHWDFMVEAGEVLRTWRLLVVPLPGQTVAAETSFDHRRLYLDHEGSISGGRGSVVRWDAGTLTWESEEDGHRVMMLRGQRLQGRATLHRDPEGRWTFRCEGGKPQ
jgi:hypothetical protein